ncbi:hypothetical protein LguiB_005534 [Lonicera macranthoides]
MANCVPNTFPVRNLIHESSESTSFIYITDLNKEHLKIHWPNLENNPDETFWEYEWDVHGTCSSLSSQQYFQTALNLKLPIVLLPLLPSNGIHV